MYNNLGIILNRNLRPLSFIRTFQRRMEQSIVGYPPETEHDFIMTKVCIVVHREDGFRLDDVIWQETVVKAILGSFYNLKSKNLHWKYLHLFLYPYFFSNFLLGSPNFITYPPLVGSLTPHIYSPSPP